MPIAHHQKPSAESSEEIVCSSAPEHCSAVKKDVAAYTEQVQGSQEQSGFQGWQENEGTTGTEFCPRVDCVKDCTCIHTLRVDERHGT